MPLTKHTSQPAPFLRLCLIPLAVFLLAAFFCLVGASAVSAQSVAACHEVLAYQDRTQNGSLDTLVLACQFSELDEDQLTIFKGSGEMDPNRPWRDNITYQDETWIFDHGAQGRASLVIQFRQDGDALVAELYDDRNGDGQVGYIISSMGIAVTENEYWTVQVVAPGGWWLREGAPNFNLHIWVDGDVEAMFGLAVYREYLETNGEPDCEIQIYDLNDNGKPSYDRRRILTPFLQEAVGMQTQMMVNFADNELPISGGFDLWPYLDLNHQWTHGSRVVKGYTASPPPVIFEPTTGRIEAVGEFVASRGNNQQCFYYSALPWEADQINNTDHESPFCFYDLAGDDQRIPELQVRALYYPPYDRYLPGGPVPQSINWIRYSWDQDNTGSWRYAVGLLGRHEFTTPVNLADYQVLSVPYKEFPTWVTERAWDIAVFSEFTGQRYFTSEGMYNVSYLEDRDFTHYVAGNISDPPDLSHEPEINFRMEWALDHSAQPYLYFSPVDRRLHLLGADAGTWQLSEDEALHNTRHGSGGQFNLWAFAVDGEVEKLMYLHADLGLLFEDRVLSFWSSTAQPPLFTALPPTDNETWAALGALLSEHEREFAPDDFSAMLAQFGGVEAAISGASLRGLRHTQNGFRFVLGLEPGFTIQDADLLGLAGTPPGKYAVTYDGAFHLQPLTPAEIQVRLASDVEPPLVALTSKGIPLHLTNTGLEDAPDLRLSARLAGPHGEAVEIEPQTLALLAGETFTHRLPFTPETPGEYTLHITLTGPGEDGPALAARQFTLTVAPAPNTTPIQDLAALGLIQPWQLGGLVLLLLLTAILFTALFADELLAEIAPPEPPAPDHEN